MLNLPIQIERQKEWKIKAAQKAQMLSRGAAVPEDFCHSQFFYTFQFDRNSVLDRFPVMIFELEQWAWMYGRWAISDPEDMSNAPDFLHVLGLVKDIGNRLDAFAGRLQQHYGLPVSESLRQEMVKLFLRFANVRSKFVSDTVAHALRTSGLRLLHDEMRTLDRIYMHDRDTLAGFLKSVFDCIATQALMHSESVDQDEYVSRAFLSVSKAFIRGIKGFSQPKDPNPLDDASSSSGKAALKAATVVVYRGDPPAASPAPCPPCPAPHPYTTIQQPIDLTATSQSAGFVTADVMARQTAAGFRAPGQLIGGLTGGGVEGIDLYPQARRVLHAQQLLHGIRAPGPLTSLPPPGFELPLMSAYPPPLPGAQYSTLPPYPGYVSPAYASTPAASPYTTVQRPSQHGAGGASGAHSLYSTGQSVAPGPSDELFIPYSTGMLGSFSPYRTTPLPATLNCYECGAQQMHFGTECPTRFARVRGEAPPGWKIGPTGAVTKDPAAWNGSELTDAARAQYRDFLAKFPLASHASYVISVDEITGPAPVAPRRPLPKPAGGGRRK